MAILLVLGFHFGERPEAVPRFFTAPFALGWSGVDLFFVLSGFLITGILIDTKASPNYFSSFYTRRVLRIFPLYLCSLAAYFFVALPLAHKFGCLVAEQGTIQTWYWLHVSNWQSAFGREAGLLTHFWSLAIEEQFYLLWPIVVFASSPKSLPRVCAGLIVASLALRIGFSGYTTTYPDLLVRLTPFRLDTLAFGGLMAVVVRNESWRATFQSWLLLVSATAAILLSATFLVAGTHTTSHPLVATLGFSLFGVLYACLVFFACTESGSDAWISRQLRHPLLRAFGKYSYAIYVLHFPLAVYQGRLLLEIANRAPTYTHIPLWFLSKILGAGLSFLLALASWHLLEKHFLQMKKRFEAQENSI